METGTLTQIGMLNAPGSVHWFQTCADKGKDHSLERKLRGTLAQHQDRLDRLSKRGAAVFIQVNDAPSRYAADVQEARVIFADFDSHEKLPPLPHVPTLTVKTKRGFHCYWKIEPTENVDRWTRTTMGLALAVGADPTVSPNKCLRLAGYVHQKSDPFLVHVIDHKPKIYSLEDFAEFELEARNEEWPAQADLVGELDFRLRESIKGRALSRCHLARPGTRYNTLIDQTWSLGHWAPYGMNLEHCMAGFCSVIQTWTDVDQAHYRKAARSNLLKGASDAKSNPPRIPERQLETWRIAEERKVWLQSLTVQELPDRIDVSAILDDDRVWRELYKSENEARHAVNRAFAEFGFSSKPVWIGGVKRRVLAR